MALSPTISPTLLKTHQFSFKSLSLCDPHLSLNIFTTKSNTISSYIIQSQNKLLDNSINVDSWKWRTRVSFFSGLLTKGKDIKGFKEELYKAIASLDRGAEASPEDQERVEEIARKLEALNEIKEPLKSNLLNGKWELLYTTSQSVLQTQRPKFLRPNGKIYQAINADTLRAQNMETWPFFNQVTANLVPLNSRRVAVKFDFFRIASLIPIKNPGSGRGQLEITYLDEELRNYILLDKFHGYAVAMQLPFTEVGGTKNMSGSHDTSASGNGIAPAPLKNFYSLMAS